MEAPELHPRLQATLDAFEASGVVLSNAEVCWLYSLRWPCDHPDDGGVPWVMGAPLEYAGETWWPQHRLAESWFLRSQRLFADDGDMRILVYLYSHIKSAPHDTSLRRLMDAATIRKTLREWYDALPLHKDQIDPLCDRLMVLDGDKEDIPDPTRRPDREPMSDGDHTQQFVAMMCKAFPGVSPEYWLTEIAASDARAMVNSVGSEGFADSEQRRAAIANYLKAVKWIWKAHSDG